MRTTKDCIHCEKPYTTNYFSERSKYCSRKCTYSHKKILKRQRLREIARQKQNATAIKVREEKLKEVTAANKAIFLVKNGDGTAQFGENVLTLKNYKEPLKQIPPKEGIGWYGVLAADVKTGKIQCHLCGQLFDTLPGHIWNTHKTKVRDYREKFGLAYSTALVSEQQRMALKERTLKWLQAMTPEEKQEYINKIRLRGKTSNLSRKTAQPKKTMEGMNKDGSCPDQTLQAIIDVKNQLGHVPSKREFIDFKGSQRYVHLVYKHFGSWPKAIEMCKFKEEEFKDRAMGGYRAYTDEELLEYLRIYAEEYQQIPTASDWKRDLMPTHDTYVERFGSIEEARQLAGVYEIVERSKRFLSRSKHYRKHYVANE